VASTLIIASISLSSSSVASAARTEYESTEIAWFRTIAPKVISVRLQAGYCVGEDPPVFQRITVHEGGRTGSKIRAVVTAYLGPAQGAKSAVPRNDQPFPEVCSGVERSIQKRVVLGRPAGELLILDGSQSPPKKIPPLSPIG
jgi:hypothetical protein